ncbi:MAG: hypothetical protein MR868_13455 [Lachnospiraceae bacterium]|nr:hypothetical protein [Lachnospiraceae bacterium]
MISGPSEGWLFCQINAEAFGNQTYERIRLTMLSLGLLHCDENGSRIDGKTWWVHGCCGCIATCHPLCTSFPGIKRCHRKPSGADLGCQV